MIFREKHGKKWNRPHSLMAAFFIFSLFLYGCGSSSSGNNVGVIVDTDPPSVPQNLTAEAVSATQINLAWDASTDNKAVTGYKIYRNNIHLASPFGTTYEDAGLSEGATYSYEVSALDAAGNESDRSLAVQETAAGVVDTEAPSVPANLTGEAVSATQINLAWDASTDNKAVTGYKIYRDNSYVASGTENSYADTGISEGHTYSYEVSAYDAAGNESDRSLAVQVTTISTGVTEAVNVFLNEILEELLGAANAKNYQFFHGSTSPDQTEILVTTNKAAGPNTGATNNMLAMILDARELEKGKAVLLRFNEIEGGSGTMNFRSTWTPDGSKIAVAAGDRFFLLNASDLTVIPDSEGNVQGDNRIGGHNHDALTTADGKFAVLTIRASNDGLIRLYDLEAGQPVGNAVSVCNSCHGDTRSSVHCGLDGVLSKNEDGTYSGTVYVAGHGGHFAEVDLVIDPTDNTNPMSVELGFLNVSGVKFAEGDSQYKLHDPRLDVGSNILYWSTYNTDANGQAHYGKIDLSVTPKKVTDIAVDVDSRATTPGPGINKLPIYCASGMTDKYFMPMTMTNEAYITVIPKDTITESTPAPTPIVKAAKNVFLDAILDEKGIGKNYQWFHGSTSPDRAQMLITTNKATGPQSGITNTIVAMLLDAKDLEKGKATLLNYKEIDGGTGAHNFRSTWTLDGSRIAMAAGDRFFVLDAATLEPVYNPEGDAAIAGHNHDALPTTDGKYAVLTVRAGGDGLIQLYDLNEGKAVGSAVSVCKSCHENIGLAPPGVIHCGLDGKIDYVTDGTRFPDVPGYGGYTGTIYVAGHGGHFAEVVLNINPTNATNPIAVATNLKLNADTEAVKLEIAKKFPAGGPGASTSQYKLHDPRLDGDTLYWSTYNTDQNGKAHYGKIDLKTRKVTADIPYAVDPRATIPDMSVDEGKNRTPIYCASGLTDRVYMPITMTNEAYITVIPKLGIK
jgi:chitodextrinase/cytochrome c553